MARKVFYSFHFDEDFWRTQQVRNIGALEGNTVCTANAWEEVKKKGDAAIERWIAEQMSGRTCVIVLVGPKTSTRPWVTHEITKGWNDGKGILGIRINKLLNVNGQSAAAGLNPLDNVNLGQKKLSTVAALKDPTGSDSKATYATISANIETWIEEAIKIRNNYKA